MGKGDKRTKRGKIFKGSHGKTRKYKSGRTKIVKVKTKTPAKKSA